MCYMCFVEKDNRQFAKVGSIEIEYNDGFRMYLVSHRSNPKFSAHLYSSAVVINFNTTLLSLENQLLDIVFASVDGDSAMERVTLYRTLDSSHKRLYDLEASLLTQIASYDGNLHDNPHTTKLLESTKHEVQKLNALICATKNTLTNIETKRNDFRLIALKAASLFFVLTDMAAINPFYQHAMCDFIDIFTQIMVSTQQPDRESNIYSSIDSGDGSGNDLNQRLLKIIADLSKRIYNIGSIGIFQKDKLLFVFRITMELEHCDGIITQNEMDFFLKQHKRVDKYVKSSISCDWLTNQQLNDIQQLIAAFPTTFIDLLKQIEINSEQWYAWHRAETPESINYPEPYATNTTHFQVAIHMKYIYHQIQCSMLLRLNGTW